MKIDNTQMASVVGKLFGSSSPFQSRPQTLDTGSLRSDTVTLSKRAQEALEEIRRLAAEGAAAKRGEAPASDAAVVSLRLNTAGLARVDGIATGGAKVELSDSNADPRGVDPSRTVALAVYTGAGADKVSISVAGRDSAHVRVHTGGGNDSIELTGQMYAAGDAGDGDDVIRRQGGEVGVVGGAGNDTFDLKDVFGVISGDAGNDQINLSWDEAAATAKRYFAKGETGGAETWTKNAVVKENVATVAFGRGGGQDVVTTVSKTGALGAADIWMHDLSASEVEAKRDGKDLVLRVKDTGDSLTLRDYDPGAWKLIRFREGEKSLADFVNQA